MATRRRVSIDLSEPMQKSSGYRIGNMTESEWRISAGFRVIVADRFSAWADFGRWWVKLLICGAVGTFDQNRRAQANLQFNGDVNITGEAALD